MFRIFPTLEINETTPFCNLFIEDPRTYLRTVCIYSMSNNNTMCSAHCILVFCVTNIPVWSLDLLWSSTPAGTQSPVRHYRPAPASWSVRLSETWSERQALPVSLVHLRQSVSAEPRSTVPTGNTSALHQHAQPTVVSHFRVDSRLLTGSNQCHMGSLSISYRSSQCHMGQVIVTHGEINVTRDNC